MTLEELIDALKSNAPPRYFDLIAALERVELNEAKKKRPVRPKARQVPNSRSKACKPSGNALLHENSNKRGRAGSSEGNQKEIQKPAVDGKNQKTRAKKGAK